MLEILNLDKKEAVSINGISNQEFTEELREASTNIEPKHQNDVANLINSYKSLYPKWVFDLRCGFGLLMYGFGSKKSLIEDFASTALADHSVVVINGLLVLHLSRAVPLKQPGGYFFGITPEKVIAKNCCFWISIFSFFFSCGYCCTCFWEVIVQTF
ncbi:hypothetical protein V6Z12_D02G123100 [Gossypium hirsutum]